jgi:hypothetical protein
MAAIGTATALELSRLALGQRGMATLAALSQRAALQGRQLFRGVDPSPITRAVDRFYQLVNVATPAGKALQSMFTGAFNTVFSAVEKAEPYVSAFIKGLIIGGLRIQESWYGLHEALLPVEMTLEDLNLGPVDGIKTAADLGAVAFRVLAGAIDEVAANIRKVIDGYHDLELGLARKGLLGEGMQEQAYRRISEREKSAREDAEAAKTSEKYEIVGGKARLIERGGAPVVGGEEVDLYRGRGVNTGAAYGEGLVKGMKGAVPAVTAAGQELGSAGDRGVRAGADAHSPSRKTEKTGEDMGSGVVLGMQRKSPDVQAEAARSLVPRLPAGAPAGGSTPASTGVVERLVVEVHHNWPAGVDAVKRAALEDAAEAGMYRALRAIAAQRGIPLEVGLG